MRNPRWSIEPGHDKAIALVGTVEVQGSGDPYGFGPEDAYGFGDGNPGRVVIEEIRIYVDNDDVWCDAQEVFAQKLLDTLNSSAELRAVDVPLVEVS